MANTVALVIFVALSFAAAAPGAWFAPGAWYASLQRPWFAPPNWVFGPVWTLLYGMIACAGWLVWRAAGTRSRAMAAWALQLVLNALWTPIFFGAHWLALALAEITLLWLAILACVLVFREVSRLASWLMVPYLAWVGFAWLLNAGFWALNR